MSTEPNHNTNNPQQIFSADRPILSSSEDKLSRKSFADALASTIRGWRGRDSLVIALYGPWGSGKSSIKNMIIDVLHPENKDSALIAEFNPWQFANRDQLTEVFFDQLGIALGRGDIGSNKQRKALVNRWRRYGMYLRATGELFANLRTGLIAVLSIVAVFLGGLAALNLVWMASMGAILLAGAVVFLRWSSKATKVVEDILAVGTEVGRRSLEEVKQELAVDLRKLPYPVLVVLDDIDRLKPTELNELFQLIKVNADFPNVVYLLLCDRRIVEQNIEKVLEVSGRDYLEKIVQVGFDVPVASQTQINRVLFDGLDQLLAEDHIERRFDQTRWGNLFLGGLQPYFGTLRQVKRFLSTLAFHISLFRGEGAFEVNPVDLIGLELLRTFEPDVYHGLAINKNALTDRIKWGGTTREEEYRRILTEILAKACEKNREHVQEIMKQLFPSTEWVLGGLHYARDFDEEWFRELRVCSTDIFDRYFYLAIPEGDISQSQIDQLLAVTGNRKQLRTALHSLAKQDLLGIALNRLEAYKETISLDHAVDFITAIFDIGEDLTTEKNGMFGISPSTHALRIVYWYLKREQNSNRRREVLREVVQSAESVSLPVRFIGHEAQRAEKEGDARSQDRLLDDEGLIELKKLCIEKIEDEAQLGKLATIRELAYVLYRWQEWGENQPATRFCEQLVQTPAGSIILAKTFLIQSSSQGSGDYVSRKNWSIRLSDIEHFIPWKKMEQGLATVMDASLPEDERRAVEAFHKAANRRRQGLPEDGISRNEDD